jgi:hypothetical protein
MEDDSLEHSDCFQKAVRHYARTREPVIAVKILNSVKTLRSKCITNCFKPRFRQFISPYANIGICGRAKVWTWWYVEQHLTVSCEGFERPYTLRKDNVVGVVIKHWAGRPRNRGLISDRGKSFPLLLRVQTSSVAQRDSHSRDVLLGGQRRHFPRDERDRGVKLTTHHHRMPKLRNSEAKPPLPHIISRRAQGQLYLHNSARFTGLKNARILWL